MNAPLFVKLIDVRRKIAKLLQYPTWADFVTEEKMIKNARSVIEVIHTRTSLVPSLI
jgi:metallopeptidase MepB